jgi:hypothetical protein
VEVLNWSKKEYPSLQGFLAFLEAGGGWRNADLPRCLANQLRDAAAVLGDNLDTCGAVNVYYESRLEGWGPGSYYVYQWTVAPASGTLAPLAAQVNAQYPPGDARAVWDANTDGPAVVFTYRW